MHEESLRKEVKCCVSSLKFSLEANQQITVKP